MDNLKESEKSLLAASGASDSNGDAGFAGGGGGREQQYHYSTRVPMDGNEDLHQHNREIEGLLDNGEEEPQQSRFKQVRHSMLG